MNILIEKGSTIISFKKRLDAANDQGSFELQSSHGRDYL